MTIGLPGCFTSTPARSPFKRHPFSCSTRLSTHRTWNGASMPNGMASGAFAAGRRPDAEPFCIVIPPPNVTGRLHIGHALNNTLAGCARPLRADARQGRSLAAGHGPCGHCHPARGGTPACRETAKPRRDGPREIPRSGLEMERRIRRRHRRAVAQARRVGRLGRANASRWTKGFRARC